jgi:hypothetical protein
MQGVKQRSPTVAPGLSVLPQFTLYGGQRATDTTVGPLVPAELGAAAEDDATSAAEPEDATTAEDDGAIAAEDDGAIGTIAKAADAFGIGMTVTVWVGVLTVTALAWGTLAFGVGFAPLYARFVLSIRVAGVSAFELLVIAPVPLVLTVKLTSTLLPTIVPVAPMLVFEL